MTNTHELSYLRPYGRKPWFSTEFVRHALFSKMYFCPTDFKRRERLFIFKCVVKYLAESGCFKQAVILVRSATLSLHWHMQVPHCHLALSAVRRHFTGNAMGTAAINHTSRKGGEGSVLGLVLGKKVLSSIWG